MRLAGIKLQSDRWATPSDRVPTVDHTGAVTLLALQATLVAAMGVGVVAQRRRWHAVPESLVLMLGGALLGSALRRQVR